MSGASYGAIYEHRIMEHCFVPSFYVPQSWPSEIAGGHLRASRVCLSLLPGLMLMCGKGQASREV